MASSPVMTVGLEVHARLLAPTKIFCSCANRYGEKPNTLVCPVCLGLPGTLPVFNMEVAHLALRVGIALDCNVHQRSEFARKNYFYPDLPRNYQITQYRFPLCTGGVLSTDAGRHVKIRRIHLEEDAGRSLHHQAEQTLIDMNRAGTPLMEIVTEPDLETGIEARDWLRRLRQILLFMAVCDGEMATGSLRCDANVGTAEAGVLVELKNLNSFKAVGQAIDFERLRLAELLAKGETPAPETRLWDEKNQCTVFMRLKEETRDYRYFPEPDLPPLVLRPGIVERTRKDLPELPRKREKRLVQEFGLTPEDSITLCQTPQLVAYFEEITGELVKSLGIGALDIAHLVCHWVLKDVLQICSVQGFTMDDFPVSSVRVAGLLELLYRQEISAASARKVLAHMVHEPGIVHAADLVKQEGWWLVKDSAAITDMCLEILAAHPRQVAAYKDGKIELLNFFVGQVMAISKGCACPETTMDCLKSQLEK